ncbi:metallopeptidase TldD-related protein [Pseudactinotalea sp. Z1748]|uniref:metallopeptidase TldD-related protein n=1 Tax=Pseudactinotalea sp. Z1748 TaxID=3413027 RepID=UPI003C7BE1C9
MSTATPQQLIEHALAGSSAEHTIALARVGSSANLRWANNTLTTNGAMREVQVTVISFRGTSDGVATGAITGTAATLEQVESLVTAADAAAAVADPAQDATELLTAAEATAPSEPWDDPAEQTSIEVYRDFAAELGEIFTRARERRQVLYGFVDHEVVTTYLASSTGVRLRHTQPSGHYGITGKNEALTSSAWVGGATRQFTDVDPAALEVDLIQRLEWSERTVSLPAERYQTVLPPTAVADLLIYAYWSAGARVAHEGQSVFSKRGGGTRIGEQIVKPQVRLYSDPAYPGLECAPFVQAAASSNVSSVFDNALPLRSTDWIADGRLTSLLQTRHSAGLTGQEVTPAISNLVLDVEGGAGTTQDLVAGMDRGLLVTCLWYIREVDPQNLLLTGLTRDGVYLVEGGEVVGAVNNFRFNESPVGLLSRFDAASATQASFSREWGDYFPRTATPALRIGDFNMSSVSQAQ